jgi:hypothetical protein
MCPAARSISNIIQHTLPPYYMCSLVS